MEIRQQDLKENMTISKLTYNIYMTIVFLSKHNE